MDGRASEVGGWLVGGWYREGTGGSATHSWNNLETILEQSWNNLGTTPRNKIVFLKEIGTRVQGEHVHAQKDTASGGRLSRTMGLNDLLSHIPSTQTWASPQHDPLVPTHEHDGQARHRDSLPLQCVTRQQPPLHRTRGQLWGAAQAARRGMPLENVNDRSQRHKDIHIASALLSRWTDFSTFTTFMASAQGGHCIAYADVWKGGNNAIHKALQTRESEKGLPHLSGPKLPRPGGSWNERNFFTRFYQGVLGPADGSCHSHWPPGGNRRSNLSACAAEGVRARGGPLYSYCDGSRRVFTFVREPMSHFISGWAEYTSRNSAWHNASSKSVRPVTEEETERFVEELVDSRRGGTNSPTHPFYHMAPMSGIRMQRFGMPQYVGRLEHAAEDWKAIFAGTPFEGSMLRADASPHTNSGDAQGARLQMRTVLKRRHDLRRAVCVLIEADYDWFECLGYNRSKCWSGEAVDEAVPLCQTSETCSAWLAKHSMRISA